MQNKIKVKIRVWQRTDFDSIRNLLLLTWKATYHFVPDFDLETHLNKFYAENELFKQKNDRSVKCFIAEVDYYIAGFMKLFENKIDKRFYISSLYILPQFQGFGIGKKLLNKSIRIAEKLGYSEVWLGVMKQNIKAFEWYTKLGFVFVEEEPFQLGSTEVMHLIGYKVI